jgi:hypothetical protein
VNSSLVHQELEGNEVHIESNRKAFRGAWVLPFGGGIRFMIASKIDSTFFPVFADIEMMSEGSIPKVDCIWAAIRSGCAAGRSI